MNPFRIASIRNIATLVFTLCYTSLVFALDSDRDQPIEIESDSAEYRENEGITTYSGNVQMTQGSMLLRADEIHIYAADGEVSRMVARGNRAYYEQKPSPEAEKVVAQAKVIEYLLSDDLINLSEQASLTQDGATLNGNLISYDVRKHLLRAKSNTQTNQKKERVKVVIPSLGATSK